MTDSPGRQFERLFEAAKVFLSRQSSRDREDLLRRHEPLRDLLAPMLEPAAPEENAAGDAAAKQPAETMAGDRRGRRYEVLEELGHGGIGVVYRARDHDLGRDVALKTLRERHDARGDVLRRFEEEARIGGQLQHPGIVPVYELGVREDARPFFAMKLVKGETLAAKLATRPHLQADRQQFLAIFEQVCQTVAYAHASGVVHRDLKPGNVMVGAFGEVQVVDWGFARVLREPGPPASAAGAVHPGNPPSVSGRTSLWGTVIGTPAYMPPEQALGDLAQMDERSDVFALGAMLYEILAGRPPYAGDGLDAAGVLELAKVCDLEAALADLEAVCADKDLVGLARQCLQRERDDRPADASIVAAGMRSHLASVSERARLAELNAARAESRAAHERRTRRLTLALAASVLVTVAGYLWVSEERAAHRALVARSMGTGLEEVQRLLGEARAGDPADARAWQLVLSRGADLEARLAEGDIDAHLQESVRQVAATVALDAAAARERAAQRERDRAMVAELEEIAMPEEALHGDGFRREEAQRAVDAYRTAFTRYGIEASAPEAAARIRGSAIATELVLGLDDWAEQERRLDKRSEQQALLRLAMAADGDAWRNELRLAMIERGPAARDRALALIDRLDPATVSPATLLTAMPAMVDAGARDRGIALLRAAYLRHPDHYALVMCLCLQLTSPKVKDGKEEAVRYATAAMALRPLHRGPRHMLGVCLHALERLDQALAVFEDASRRAPSCGHWWWHIGLVHKSKGDELAAMRAYEQDLATPEPTGFSALNLSGLLLKQGKTAEALAAARKAVSLSHRFAGAHWNLALVLEKQGETDQALDAMREAARLDPKRAHALSDRLRARGKSAEAVAAARVAVAHAKESSDTWMSLAYSLEQQGGQTEEMLHALREAVRLDPKRAQALSDWLRARGESAEAVAAARVAVAHAKESSDAWMSLAYSLEQQGGQTEEMLHALREMARLAPESAHRQSFVGSKLYDHGDFAGAEAHHRAALALGADPYEHVRLGSALERQQRYADAAMEYEKATQREPGLAQAWQWLGDTRHRLLDFAGAIEAMERARDLAPDADWRRQRESDLRRMRRDQKLHEQQMLIAEGKAEAKSTGERHRVAEACLRAKRFELALRMYERVFEDDPRIAEAIPTHGNRYNAACCAILVAAAEAKTAERRAPELRGKALAWLQADLARWEELCQAGSTQLVEQGMAHWLADPDLATVREPDELGKLSLPEQEAWQKLWQMAGALQARARGKGAGAFHDR